MPPDPPLPVAPLERLLREFWAHFDAKDYEALSAMMTEDGLETDDLAQGWLRGQAAIGEHFARMGDRYEDSHTALEDVKVTETSANAMVTCVVVYQLRWDSQPGSWRWPTTMIFVREAGTWKNRTAPHQVAGRGRAAARRATERRMRDRPRATIA